MQYVVYGAGAVGGGVGALLSETGVPVTLLARGEHLAAIRRQGLTVTSGARTFSVRGPTGASAGDVDWSEPATVLLAVKSQDTESALRDLARHAPPDTVVACVQNGIANERAALRYFERVVAVCVVVPATHLEPGVVEIGTTSPGILDCGDYPTGVGDVSRSLSQAVRTAGFASEPREDVMAWKHRKLLMNLGNAVDACCQPGDDADRLTALATAEGEAVLAAASLPVVDADVEARRREGHTPTHAEVSASRSSSSRQSLTRRAGSIESDFLNGEIVLLGRLHTVPTPVNALLQRTARRLADEQGEPGSIPAAELLARL